MIRRASRVPSVARKSSWLIVAVGLTLSVSLLWAFPAAQGWPEAPPLWWLAQAGVPIVYGILVGVFVRAASWPRLLGATALLWAGHLLVGALTDGVIASLQASGVDGVAITRFPPSPLPQLLWLPLLLIPFHDAIVGDPRFRRNGRGPRDRSPVPGRRAPMAVSISPADAPPAPVVPAALSAEGVTTGARERRGESGARPAPSVPHTESAASRTGLTSSPSPTSATAVAETPAARRTLDEMLARETSADVVRVSFARIADQLPAAAFNLPLERMAASLLEPGYLLVPQRLVLAQLAEGLVRAGWETVAEQFPRHLLALNDADITRRLREGQLVLPLDELVPQLAPELFRVAGSLVDLEGIETFPEPFKPIEPEPGQSLAAPIAEAVSTAIAEPEIVTDPRLGSTTSDLLEDEAVAPVGACPLPTVEVVAAAPLCEDAEAIVSTGRELSEDEAAAPVGACPLPTVEVVAAAPLCEDAEAVVSTGRELSEDEAAAPVGACPLPTVEVVAAAPLCEDAEAIVSTGRELSEDEAVAPVGACPLPTVEVVAAAPLCEDAEAIVSTDRELSEDEAAAPVGACPLPTVEVVAAAPLCEDAEAVVSTDRELSEDEAAAPVGACPLPTVEVVAAAPLCEDAEAIVSTDRELSEDEAAAPVGACPLPTVEVVATAPLCEDAEAIVSTDRELSEDEAAAPVGACPLPTVEVVATAPLCEDAEAIVSTDRELSEDEAAASVSGSTPPTVDLIEPARPGRDEAESGPQPLVVAADRPEAGEPESHEAPALADELVEEPVTKWIVAAPPVDPARRGDLAAALEIAALLTPIGPLNAAVDAEDGVTLVSLSSPGLSVPTVSAAARLMLPILAGGRGPWPVDQLTLRGPEGALVLTPLPPERSGGRVLVTAVPPQGSLALLEILCRRAAACHGGGAGSRPERATGGDRSDLLEVEPSTRIRDIGASLSAVGPVVPSAFRDADAETVVYLFLPAECDAQAIAGFAHALGRAMLMAGRSGMPMQSAELAVGGRRLMLRLADLARGCADIIVVAGGRIDRPGLAHRQLESAVRALRAG